MVTSLPDPKTSAGMATQLDTCPHCQQPVPKFERTKHIEYSNVPRPKNTVIPWTCERVINPDARYHDDLGIVYQIYGYGVDPVIDIAMDQLGWHTTEWNDLFRKLKARPDFPKNWPSIQKYCVAFTNLTHAERDEELSTMRRLVAE
jgi:hypothetical protein